MTGCLQTKPLNGLNRTNGRTVYAYLPPAGKHRNNASLCEALEVIHGPFSTPAERRPGYGLTAQAATVLTLDIKKGAISSLKEKRPAGLGRNWKSEKLLGPKEEGWAGKQGRRRSSTKQSSIKERGCGGTKSPYRKECANAAKVLWVPPGDPHALGRGL